MPTLGCIPSKKDIRDYKLKRKLALAVVYPEEYCLRKIAKIKNHFWKI